MSNYRPYLWGSFAISHYQVKNHLISKTLNSFPSTTDVLCYIPLKRLKETISNFPINRMLYVKVSIQLMRKVYIMFYNLFIFLNII